MLQSLLEFRTCSKRTQPYPKTLIVHGLTASTASRSAAWKSLRA